MILIKGKIWKLSNIIMAILILVSSQLSFILFKGKMVHGERNGFGKYIYKNGDRFEGEWKNNKMEGKGTCFYADGGLYNGQ